ncbi:cyclase family protein [Carpediemonas membranifera]|uniref:Cyclase family protein n=1 Tax=Carpediemonas membranifera TaxID=201153 RepID=A0A8J6E1Q6_9EUKA|nr:cyclase family protein [Carpediemonas membranifera]|eukprot:KAG9396669.1 cyclase family protein [Carpediemonas membranifera]
MAELGAWIDLSHEYSQHTPPWPGDRLFRLLTPDVAAESDDNTIVEEFEASTHLGTHIDAPLHFLPGQKAIGDFDVSHFAGAALVLDVRGQQTIVLTDAQRAALAETRPDGTPRCPVVLIHTAWDERWGGPGYFEGYPVLAPETVAALVAARVHLVGLDTPSPDAAPFLAHPELLRHDVLIVENLRGLGCLLGATSVEFAAFPLRMRCSGSPVRAVARRVPGGAE